MQFPLTNKYNFHLKFNNRTSSTKTGQECLIVTSTKDDYQEGKKHRMGVNVLGPGKGGSDLMLLCFCLTPPG